MADKEQQTEKLLPQIPVLTEYLQVKQELTTRIEKLNAIKELTEENKKEVKNGIAEINKVKDRISRFRIDNQNAFLKYIEPCINQCKELEDMCSKGLSEIKAKVKELEEKEKSDKKATIKQLWELKIEATQNRTYLKFDMFFQESMTNKTTSMNIIEKQMTEFIESKDNDINFIKTNTDDPEAILLIYLENGLNLTQAIKTYQDRFKSEAEISAMIAAESSQEQSTSFEKKLDICIKIKQLPKSKVKALQGFLDGLGVEFDVEVME